MIQDIKIEVIGGDIRSLAMAKELIREGYSVAMLGVPDMGTEDITIHESMEDAVKFADIIILGIPYSIDGKRINCTPPIEIKEFFEQLPVNTLVLGGRFDGFAYTLADEYSIRIIDYSQSEEMATLNAVPTAEGALELAMKELDITLYSSKALVLGYGRIGKVLARDLKALGAEVTVAARRVSDRTMARIMGCLSVDTGRLSELKDEYDIIFNTVPVILLTEEILKKIPKNTLIIDLASKPGGVDMKAAKQLSSKVIWALSLPGKVAPVSAGRIIASTVMNILDEEGIL